MRRLGAKLGIVVLVAGTLGGLAAPVGASAKKTPKIKNSDFQRYYKSAKSKTAFHFETIKSGKKTQNYIILGDFGSNPGVRYGVPTTKFKLSKNGKTLSTKYKLIQFKLVNKKYKTSLTKQTYTFKMTKKSASKFTSRLSANKNRHLNASGKAYSYTLTKSNPVVNYTNKYAKPTLYAEALAAVQSQYPDATETEQQAAANQLVDSATTNLIKNFNFKF